MEIKVEINGCNITAKIYFHLIFVTFQFMHDLHKSLFLLFCECFTVIAKQRIDSGFFLFQAEQKKKAEKKKNKRMIKTKCAESSEDEFL